MKKFVCLLLAMMFLISAVSCAYATNYGVVNVRDYLNLRKKASTSSVAIGYLAPQTLVEVLNNMSVTNGFYRVTGNAYKKTNLSGTAERMTGYAHKDYIVTEGID